MSNESNGGSDLDIFEGLGKKASERTAAAPPAPPPGPASSSRMPAVRPAIDAKRTLLGVAVPPVPLAAQPPPSVPPPLPPSARPPVPPPASASVEAAAPAPAPAPVSAQPPPVSAPPLGVARSGSVPPPPPGRASLPNFVPPRAPGDASPVSAPPPASRRPSSASGQRAAASVPPPISTRPGVGARPPSVLSVPPAEAPVAAAPAPAAAAAPVAPETAPTALVKNSAKLDMDWDDDQEATQIFDKEASKADQSAQSLIQPTAAEPERASMDMIMSNAPPPPAAGTPAVASPLTSAAPTLGLGVNNTAQMAALSPSTASASLSGAFAALGSNGVPSARISAPPPTQPTRSAPPAPPASMRSPGVTPPPPPGQVTTAPMHMPLQPQQQQPQMDTMQSAQSPLPMGAPMPSAPPPSHAVQSAPPPSVQLPPVSRAMDATHMVPRVRPGRSPLVGVVLAGVAVAVGLAVFLLWPRTGTLVVNVADTKGGIVSNLEITVDGTKRCDSAPCIVRDVSAGVHEVKVSAKGYEAAAPRAITVDGKRDQSTDFQLSSSKATTGTGLKVAAAHSGVKLAVDGKDIGLLPQELRDLSPGEHTIRLHGERYVSLEKTISVAKDEIVDLGTLNLKVSKGKATIVLGTPGAKVYIVSGSERKEVPQLPVAIEFGPSEKWELRATKDGFEEYREAISFEDGQAEKTFTVSLTPKGAAVAATPAAPAVAAPKWTPPAATPAAPKEPAAPAPKAAAAPAAPAEQPKAAAATGESVLKINSLPASAIVLDGKPIGTTPQLHVVVSPGSHTIMFVNAEQSLKKTITVDVKAGETKAAFAKLRD